MSIIFSVMTYSSILYMYSSAATSAARLGVLCTVLSNKCGRCTWRDGRLGLAIVPLYRGTGAPFDEHRRPLAPTNFFDNNGNNFS